MDMRTDKKIGPGLPLVFRVPDNIPKPFPGQGRMPAVGDCRTSDLMLDINVHAVDSQEGMALNLRVLGFQQVNDGGLEIFLFPRMPRRAIDEPDDWGLSIFDGLCRHPRLVVAIGRNEFNAASIQALAFDGIAVDDEKIDGFQGINGLGIELPQLPLEFPRFRRLALVGSPPSRTAEPKFVAGVKVRDDQYALSLLEISFCRSRYLRTPMPIRLLCSSDNGRPRR